VVSSHGVWESTENRPGQPGPPAAVFYGSAGPGPLPEQSQPVRWNNTTGQYEIGQSMQTIKITPAPDGSPAYCQNPEDPEPTCYPRAGTLTMIAGYSWVPVQTTDPLEPFMLGGIGGYRFGTSNSAQQYFRAAAQRAGRTPKPTPAPPLRPGTPEAVPPVETPWENMSAWQKIVSVAGFTAKWLPGSLGDAFILLGDPRSCMNGMNGYSRPCGPPS